jgi:hypothetical protein
MAEELYSTTDFYITAVLIAEDYEVQDITREGPDQRVKRFHFEDSKELRNAVLQYMNGKLNGSYKKFKQAIETVKDMVHSG